MALKQVSFTVALPLLFFRDGEMIVAFTPALRLSSCGRTLDEAEKNFNEALEIFLEECVKRGTMRKALDELGWKKLSSRPPRWLPPVSSGRFSDILSEALHRKNPVFIDGRMVPVKIPSPTAA